jgi:hypothetical protein
MPDTTRAIRAILTAKSEFALRRLANRLGLGETDLVNRAIQVYDLLEAEKAAGVKIVLWEEDGTNRGRELKWE